MAAPDNTFVSRDYSLMVDDVEYNNQAWVARLVPETPIVSQRTLAPDGAIVDVDSSLWTFEVTFAQINHTGGLAKVLRDAPPGTEFDCVLVPHAPDTVGSPQATFTVLSLPGVFGGTQGQLASNELVLPVKGSPAFGTVSA